MANNSIDAYVEGAANGTLDDNMNYGSKGTPIGLKDGSGPVSLDNAMGKISNITGHFTNNAQGNGTPETPAQEIPQIVHDATLAEDIGYVANWVADSLMVAFGAKASNDERYEDMMQKEDFALVGGFLDNYAQAKAGDYQVTPSDMEAIQGAYFRGGLRIDADMGNELTEAINDIADNPQEFGLHMRQPYITEVNDGVRGHVFTEIEQQPAAAQQMDVAPFSAVTINPL